MQIPVPECVQTKLEELIKLCDENPETIPTYKLAGFLHVKQEGIKDSIDKGQCPFGFSWKLGENRGIAIPTATFYLWFTNYRGWGES